MSIFLCGNTGIKNRGCEAIIRSTVKELNYYNGDITLASLNYDQDYLMTKELGINLIGYNQYPSKIIRYCVGGVRKLRKKSLAGMGIVEKPLFDALTADDICLTIGGDTYCYNRPVIAFGLNKFTNKKKIRNILWCCSIGQENLDEEKVEDLKKYYKIFAREGITYQTLLEAGIPKEKVEKVCDPAFFLNSKQIELPEGFEAGNTIGINLSQMVINDSNELCRKNILNLINFILEKTKYKICLIPHVYDVQSRDNDLEILDDIYSAFESNRVILEERELNCEELKYLISKCAFFVGARTHSTIAAYSTGVPTLVLGYSVKSIGIAKDLFGTHEGFVIPYQDLKECDELTNAFVGIMDKEKDIRTHLETVIPLYRKELSDAIHDHLRPIMNSQKGLICSGKRCTGCEACVKRCPHSAISLKKDKYGFWQTHVDQAICTNCQICNQVCPVITREIDRGEQPQTEMIASNDSKVLKCSSSGGVFFELAKTVHKKGGYVCGAVFNPLEKKVQHIITNDINEITGMRGSKYVQSDMGDIHVEIKRLLDENNTVLFSGLPCQVEGLVRFLGKDYQNLICIDLVCHGICSPDVFSAYLSSVEKTYNKSIVDIQMRSKKEGWKKYGVNIVFDDTSELFERATDNRYMRGYINGLFMRDSCSPCAFKKRCRVSDLTLGDAWGFEELCPSSMGASIVFIHSDKGRGMIDDIRSFCSMRDVDFFDAVKNNSSYIKSASASPLKRPFRKYLSESKDFDKAIDRYLGSNYVSACRRKLIKLKSNI